MQNKDSWYYIYGGGVKRFLCSLFAWEKVAQLHTTGFSPWTWEGTALEDKREFPVGWSESVDCQ